MSDSLIVERVENTPEQLKFMPLKGSIRLKLSDTINPELAKEYIKVYRISDVEGITSYARTYSDSLREDLAKFVDIEVSASGQVLIVSAKDSFIESSDYILYISKDIHSVKNTVTHSGGTISSVLVYPPTSDTIEIIPVSDLIVDTSGNSVFVATIIVNGSLYKKDTLINVEDGIVINNSLITITDSSIIDESPIVITADISRTSENDYELRFSTGTAAPLGDKVPDGTSSKVTTEDIMNFYNNPYMSLVSDTKNGGNTDTSIGTPSTSSASESSSILIESRYPNKILFRFENEIDEQSTDLDSIDVDMYEAFDNYNLPRMGLYKDDEAYVLEFSIIRGGKVLQIEVFKNPDNTGDRIIKRWK